MGLMSSLKIGISGLTANQYAINATAHNLANVDTEGYVRQQVVMGTVQHIKVGESYLSSMQTGLGVNTEEVKQARNFFLDKAYRRELGREAFYQSQFDAVDEMENVFGEIAGVAFQDSLKGFWESLQEMAKEPDSIVTRATLVESAVSLMERSENIYKQIVEYQTDLNKEIEKQVNRINEIGDKIRELNRKICLYEANGTEHANDYRDQRNTLLDELGQYMNITFREGLDHQVTVMAEGVPFVTEDLVFHMSTRTQVDLLSEQLAKEYDGDMERANQEAEKVCRNARMLVPVWPAFGGVEVFNFDVLPNMKANTDIGSLKGLILSRGSRIGNFTDIPVQPKEKDFIDEDGELDEAAYTEAMVQYRHDVRTYNAVINPSVIMTMQAMFDQLIHGIVSTINDILCPNTDYTFTEDVTVELSNGLSVTYHAGDTVKVFDRENAPIGMDEDQTAGTELFSRKSVSRYETVTLSDGTELMIYNEEDPNNNYSLYTLGELEVNREVLYNKSKIPLSSNKGTGDFEIKTVERIIEAWQEDFATLSPNTLTMNNFNNYYTALIGELANRGETMKTIVEDQDSMVRNVDFERQTETGVSSDEELTNLIRFQHAYNAAARYVNVIDEMLEHLVTAL